MLLLTVATDIQFEEENIFKSTPMENFTRDNNSVGSTPRRNVIENFPDNFSHFSFCKIPIWTINQIGSSILK